MPLRRRVLFVEQEIPHYRAGVLAAIAKGVSADFHFFLGATSESQAFLDARATDLPHPVSTLFVRWFLGGRLVLQNYWSALRNARTERCLVIVRHNPRSLLLVPFMLWCRLRGIPVVVWGQGFSRKRKFRPRRHPLDFLNLSIARLARAYVAYTEEIRRELSPHVDSRKLFTACNTLDLSSIGPIRRRLESESKKRVRSRLGLRSQYYLVFIGRLQARKRADLFLHTLARLQQEHNMSVGGIIIGHGPQEASLRQLAEETALRDLRFTGGLRFEESADFLFAADALLIPGWLGLAVNHAFFFGMPVIGQTWDGSLLHHGPEAAYITEGETGRLADARRPGSLVAAARDVLEHHQEMGRKARAFFDSNLDIARMVDGFRRAIDFAMPPESEPADTSHYSRQVMETGPG